MLERAGEWVEDHPLGSMLCGIGLFAAVLTGIVGLIVAVVPEQKPGIIKARTEAAAVEWAKGIGYEDPKVVCDDYAASMNDHRSVGCTLATERGGRLQALRCSAYMGTSAACRVEVAAP
jgi:hypothetical protein